MTLAALIRRSITTFTKRVVLFLTLTVSSLAAAQAVPTIGAGAGGGSKVPYRGTSLSYGHSITPYNYTNEVVSWTHRMGIMPEWHFTDAFAVRARFYLTQEFTLSDTTNTPYEVELSDLWLDAVWGGWKEKHTGIRLGGDLRATFPTSKQSRAVSRLFTLAPGINVSRTFGVLSGLTFVYSARFTWRFNRFTTRQNEGGLISNCNANAEQVQAVGFIDACNNSSSGANNVQADVLHGPTVVFNPHERVNISASLFMQRGWVSPMSAYEGEGFSLPARNYTRDFIGFSLGVSYQPWDVVGFTLGAFTFANQLDTTGNYIFPLFNRNTAASLDATFDLEAIVSSIAKEQK